MLELFRANKEEGYYFVVKLTHWFGGEVLVTTENEDKKSATLASMNLVRHTLEKKYYGVLTFSIITSYSLRQFLYQGILC